MENKHEIGDVVDYHAEIGGAITSKNHTVESTGEMCGTNVCWISDKSGCVDEDALTPSINRFSSLWDKG